jgi:hypothetical protein
MIIYTFVIALLCTAMLHAQPRQIIRWSAEASSYYSLNTADNGGYDFHDLMNTAARTGAGLNILRATAALDAERIHGAISLQYGDIAQTVWGKQFPLQEGWLGYRVTSGVDIQAGVFLSHFGVEGMRPSENYSGIVSTTGFFDPNYFGGVKCYVALSDVMLFHADVLTSFNGLEIDGEIPAYSLNLEYRPDSLTQLAWNSILSEEPLNEQRVYQSYTQMSATLHRGSWHLIGEVNIGAELPTSVTPGLVMTSGLLGCYYDVDDRLQVGLRGEYVIDRHGIVADDRYASPLPINELSAAGATATMNYAAASWCTIRADVRRLTAIDSVSVIDANPSVRARTEAVLTVEMYLGGD